ncbi:sugar transferase [Paenibacillus sp. FSL R5-0527]|uniref:sugar transferase n=1 Tax=Paenibacillus sp. FSL R5-0527 TaxID=2975321 RepID=UPI0026CE3A8A
MNQQDTISPLSARQRFVKHAFDFGVALIGFVLTWWIMVLAVVIASADTRSFGLFAQTRIGAGGKKFTIYKVKTMRAGTQVTTTVTARNDPRVTATGKWMRKLKIDELPQLLNILLGQMSFVGPRPDVAGFMDRLEGGDRIILTLRPGITGPATIKYRHEEAILASVPDPETYNREVIFPDKVRINKEYIRNYTFAGDIRYILQTVFPGRVPSDAESDMNISV